MVIDSCLQQVFQHLIFSLFCKEYFYQPLALERYFYENR